MLKAVKGKFYECSGSECWVVEREIKQRMSVSKIRRMCGVKREDWTMNKNVRCIAHNWQNERKNTEMVGACSREKMEAVRVAIRMNVKGRREIPKNIWSDKMENDMKAACVCIRDIEDRDKWILRTRLNRTKELERS